MYKQSSFVLALFLGTASTVSINENFATGMNGDEDLGEDISMKGDKFHFNQYVMMDAEPAANVTANATAPSAGTPAAKYPAPEKVHTLDPKIAKAHTTFYDKQHSLLQVDPDVRTAFYAQYDEQNGLWRTSDELVAIEGDTVPQVQKSLEDSWARQERFGKVANVPMIHPYNYDPWVYKFSRDAMGPHSQHIDDDPEDSRPKSKEELAGTPEAIAKKEAGDAAEKKLKDAAQEMKNGAEKEPSAADEAKKDAEALDAAMKKADLAEAVAKVEKKEEKKEEKKAELLMTAINVPNKFYNAQDGLWMFDTTLVGAEPEKKEAEAPKVEAPQQDLYGDTEKVQNLMPKRYQLGANTNMVNGVNVRRTTFYGQQQPEYVQIQGEPENSVQSSQYDEFGPAEKVQNLMPRRYERSANSNKVDGVRVSRTTYYTQLEDDVTAPSDQTPTEQVAILEPVAYKHAADTNLPFTRTTFY